MNDLQEDQGNLKTSEREYPTQAAVRTNTSCFLLFCFTTGADGVLKMLLDTLACSFLIRG